MEVTMTWLSTLWMPIVLSAIVVFIASSIMWMALPHHKTDWIDIAGGDARLLSLIKELDLWGRQYVFPAGLMGGRRDPALAEALKDEPTGFLIVRPHGGSSLGRSLVYYFIFNLIVSVFVGYLAYHTLPPGADYLSVFRVTGTATILAYGAGAIPEAVFFGRSWSMTFKQVLDGIVYGLLTAGVFGWLWPR
jgi:hypothetical protein